MVLMAFVLSASAQDRTVTGKVTDDKGNPISNVSVVVKGTNKGTTTDSDGIYSISLTPKAKVLVFSSVNMKLMEIPVGSGSVIDVTLAPDDKSLQEVVVTGYEIKKKRDIAGATVSTKGKNIASRPVGSFAKAMQGEMAGVQVIANNGVPGGNVTVRIRGVGSINASTTPLFIVDGVQIVSGNSNSLNSGNGPETSLSSNLLNSINPNDIESIDVLKDPASASIYGAQAANGVVIITTKKGKNGKSKINFSNYVGYTNVIKKLDILNATEFTQLGYEAFANRFGATATQTNTFLTAVGGATVTGGIVNPLPSTDWQNLAFVNGFVQNYDLSLSGGNEKTSFFMSGGYNKLQGHVKASDFTRGSFRVNVDHKINKKLSVGTSLALSVFSQNGVLNGGSFGNPVRSSFLAPPSNTVYLPNGTLRSQAAGTWFGGIDNFLTYTDYDINSSNVKNIVGGINLMYRINNNFTFRTTANINYNITNEKQFNDPRYSGAPTGTVSRFATEIADYQTNQVLNYNQTFGKTGKHVVSALAGTETRINVNSNFGAFGTGLALPQFTTLSSTSTASQPSEGFSDFKLLGMFGKVGYIYNDKYILNFTVRRDGSSRFGKNTRYGVFPAISTAWRISDEKFFGSKFRENNDIKLRFSYGKTGNQAGIGVYAARSLFGLSGEYNGLSGAAPSQLGNTDLSWEENETYNAGVDFNLFNRRVSLEVDVFHSNRNKLLLLVPLPNTSGFASINRNVGSLRNRGIEVGLNTSNIQKNNFKWTTGFNVSYGKNKVIRLAPGQVQIGTAIKIGQPLNSVFTYKYAGVNPADGRPFYYDTLGNITYVPQLRDRYYLDGTLDPTFFGALTNTFSFSGFEFRFQFQFQGGNFIQNSDASFLQRAGSSVDRNQAKSQLERWQRPGDITRVPRPFQGGTQPGASSNSFFSDRFFERGDFARLKEVTLTYNFSKDLIKKFGMSSGSFYVSGLNLHTWSKYSMFDPEVKDFDFGQYPQARQMTFGFNLGL